MPSIESTNARTVFDRAASRMDGPWSDALEQCIPVGHQSVRDNFNSSATPDDQNWPPRKIEGDGHRLLMLSGTLMQAATGGGPGGVVRIEGNELIMGVDLDIVPYARAHNLGYPEGHLPQREFLGLRLRAAQEAESIIGVAVERTLFG